MTEENKEQEYPQTMQSITIGSLILSSSTLILDELIARAKGILSDEIFKAYLIKVKEDEQARGAGYTG